MCRFLPDFEFLSLMIEVCILLSSFCSVINIISVMLQVEQVSFAAVLDVLIIIVMAAIWAFMPTDGIAIVTQWFYNKVIEVMHDQIYLCYCLTRVIVNCCQSLAIEHHFSDVKECTVHFKIDSGVRLYCSHISI